MDGRDGVCVDLYESKYTLYIYIYIYIYTSILSDTNRYMVWNTKRRTAGDAVCEYIDRTDWTAT